MNTINIKPISVNECFKGRRYRTKKYKDWVFNCVIQLPKELLLHKEYIFFIDVYYSNKSSDIDNCLKPFFDMLQYKYKDFDDRKVMSIVINKHTVKKGEDKISFTFQEYKKAITPEEINVYDTACWL